MHSLQCSCLTLKFIIYVFIHYIVDTQSHISFYTIFLYALLIIHPMSLCHQRNHYPVFIFLGNIVCHHHTLSTLIKFPFFSCSARCISLTMDIYTILTSILVTRKLFSLLETHTNESGSLFTSRVRRSVSQEDSQRVFSAADNYVESVLSFLQL